GRAWRPMASGTTEPLWGLWGKSLGDVYAVGYNGTILRGTRSVPGPATQLIFTVQPSNTSTGTVITPAVQVTGRDATGNVATGFTGTVALAIENNAGSPPGTLSGTTTVAAV